MGSRTDGVDAATVAAVRRQLNAVAVRAYLAAKPAGEIVGYAHKADSCPLAGVLRERLGLATSVGRGQIIVHRYGKNQGSESMTDTADLDQDFISGYVAAVDQLFPPTTSPDDGRRVYRPITGEDALAVLDGVDAARP